jgi:hypothetical protein
MKTKIILWLIPLFLFSIIVSAEDFMQLTLDCQKEKCIQGRIAEWNLTVLNLGKGNSNILGYRIKDAVSNEDIIYYEKEKPIQIASELKHIFSSKKEIPIPNKEDSLIVNICIITEPPMDAWGKVGKKMEHCYDEINFTIPTIGCSEDLDCEGSEFCKDTKCISLNCSYCEYTYVHECMPYQCCRNEECLGNEICNDHKCKKVTCAIDEYIINHTCSTTACKHDEGITNFTCVPLDCNDNETIVNYECTLLSCANEEYAYNHTCKLLNCSYNEYPLDHTCVELNCSYNEAYVNHTCSRLNCNVFQKAQKHECRINSFIILEIFLVATIIFLIVLDREKYQYIQKKKVVNAFLELLKVRKRENIKTGEAKDKKEEKDIKKEEKKK